VQTEQVPLALVLTEKISSL